MAAKRKQAKTEPRADSYQNLYSGIGDPNRDRRAYTTFQVERWTQEAAEDVWRGDDLAATIVETLPKDMTRKGYEVTTGDKDTDEALRRKREELGVMHHWCGALCKVRALGGSGVFVGADDGLDPSKPLAEDRIKTIRFLNVLTPRELEPVAWYDDPRQVKYGQPQHYQLRPYAVGVRSIPNMLVHESRIVPLRGPVVSYRANVDTRGWGDSVFVRIWPVLRDFANAWDSVGVMLGEFSVAVWKMKGLYSLLASNGATALKAHIDGMQYSRSVLRATVVDSEGDFEYKARPTTGLPEILKAYEYRLATAARMPHTRLFGAAPGGLNATGEGDQDNWDDVVEAEQEMLLRGPAERVERLIMLAKDGPTGGKEPEGWKLTFNPLRQMTEKEKAELRKLVAEADAIELSGGVLLPEEVTASRHGGDAWSAETVVDMAGRQAMVEAEAQARMEAEAMAAAKLAAPKGEPVPPDDEDEHEDV